MPPSLTYVGNASVCQMRPTPTKDEVFHVEGKHFNVTTSEEVG
eukprot:CAMPEP_0168537028 /NCGR_PEP_ID=MMETSP0405-20121227/20030_1 /TAXON_ID=498012 /ORGANISM="Trichosphaerium sp, Strain Am-I-7 wt" /LENGTH=42 /DNA_ID= /DNA_START= /DNA_END= /DNA_ORIENTATION=